MENSSTELLRKRQRFLFPSHVPYYEQPLHLTRARGCRVWDAEGREYLDGIGGIVTISVGHNHPRIKAKLQAMLANDAIQHTSQFYLSMYMEELAEKLAALAPLGLDRSYFTNSGSEANEIALLCARVSTGEQMVVALRLGYHGGTNATLNLCGHSTWKFPHNPSGGVTHAQAPYCYRCPFGAKPTTCNLECAEDVKRAIEFSTPGRIAAIIVEPIMGVGGFIDPPPAYHQRVFAIAKEYGAKFIADEVQTGVGRTGKNFFAISDSDVVPDMITMAKGLGNGVAIGAVLANEDCANGLKGKVHFNTFGGDPYQCMQAGEVLDILRDEQVQANVQAVGDRLKTGVQALAETFPVIGDVRGRGLLLGLELVTDRSTKEPDGKAVRRVMEAAKNVGLLLGRGGYWGNVIRIAPPLTLTENEADELLEKLRQALGSQR